ncbi:MAG: hypothetical protein IT440_04475 [Phycisphaeraceae bacterium]|nr:hypothetical protein [Phycisphaeraceae bacterium]
MDMAWQYNWQWSQGRLHQRMPRIGGLPSWVTCVAVLAALVVIVLPMLALILAAVLVGAIVMALLSLVALVIRIARDLWRGLTGGWSTDDDGRRNVRVLPRQD